MTTSTPPDGPELPLAPTARWQFERTDGGLALSIWPNRHEAVQAAKICLRMQEDQARAFLHGIGDVLNFTVAGGEGYFTPVPDPDQVAGQLSAARYTTSASSVTAHMALVQASPWANWVEQYLGEGVIEARVVVFAGDVGNFLDLAGKLGVEVEPVP